MRVEMFTFLLAAVVIGFSASSLVPGAPVAVQQDDPDVRNAAEFAVEAIDEMRNNMFKLKLKKVIEAQSQIVNGAIYRLTLLMATTDCRKTNKRIQLENCNIDEEKVEECKVKVHQDAGPKQTFSLEQPFDCYDSQTRKPNKDVSNNPPGRTAMLGGSEEENDANVANAMANFAIQQHNAKSNHLNKDVLIKVEKISKQLVAGWLYHVSLYMGESLCDNDNAATLASDCPLKQNGKVHRCEAQIWVQMWLKPQSTLKAFRCRESSLEELGVQRNKRFRRQTLISVPSANKEMKPIQPTKKQLLGSDDHDIGNFGAFREFMLSFNKTYKNDSEMKYRFKIFRKNMKKVVELNNAELGPDETRARYGATIFADLSESEFRKHYLTPQWDLSKRPDNEATIPKMEIPTSFDWRDHNAVTGVKNQGACGSCWAFSTTGNVEGQWAVKKKTLVSLSEQELVDCDHVDSGCMGGLPSQAYKEIMRIGGLETEKQYPYEAENEKCKFVTGDAKVYINGSVAISKNEAEIAAWLVANGPISIGINAMAMQFYFGGVSHPWKIFCNPNSLDHGVLIVGYGVQKHTFMSGETPYWIIKNSWGESWGEKGYYRIYRGAGVCGVNQMCTSATVN